MPILYVHGVATRDSLGFEGMKPYLRRIVAPAISSDPDGVAIDEVFWGGSAAAFAWKGASRPRTRLRGQGAAEAEARPADALVLSLLERQLLRRIPESPTAAAPAGGLISGTRAAGAAAPPVRLSTLTNDELSDVLTALILASGANAGQAADLAIHADAIARDPAVRVELQRAGTGAAEAAVIAGRIDQRAKGAASLAGMGSGVLGALRDRLTEALSRGTSLPAYAASILAAELRPGLNELASLFLGDVFVYLAERGDAASPGPIVELLLAKLQAAHAHKQSRGGEPVVVISHSMGGQLVYDAVTYFLPALAAPDGIRIDFWCATASQVAFFEELKLFGLKDLSIRTPAKMPFPGAHLGVWWNVWDSNDFLSFTAADVFDSVDDEAYDSGLSLLGAHSGYLQRPSFFRRLADKLARASKSSWRTV